MNTPHPHDPSPIIHDKALRKIQAGIGELARCAEEKEKKRMSKKNTKELNENGSLDPEKVMEQCRTVILKNMKTRAWIRAVSEAFSQPRKTLQEEDEGYDEDSAIAEILLKAAGLETGIENGPDEESEIIMNELAEQLAMSVIADVYCMLQEKELPPALEKNVFQRIMMA